MLRGQRDAGERLRLALAHDPGRRIGARQADTLPHRDARHAASSNLAKTLRLRNDFDERADDKFLIAAVVAMAPTGALMILRTRSGERSFEPGFNLAGDALRLDHCLAASHGSSELETSGIGILVSLWWIKGTSNAPKRALANAQNAHGHPPSNRRRKRGTLASQLPNA